MLHNPEEYYDTDVDDSVAERFAGTADDPYAAFDYEDE